MGQSPRDPELYATIKRRVQRQYGRWSAYASGALVQQYTKAYRAAHGPRSRPYVGARSRDPPLARWFRENWTDVKTGRPCGGAKSDSHYPTCRPRSQYEALTHAQRRAMVRRKQKAGSKTTSYRGIL